MGDSFAPPVKAADNRVKVTPVDRSLKYSKDKHEESGVGMGYILGPGLRQATAKWLISDYSQSWHSECTSAG